MALTRRELVGLLGSGALAAAAGPALWAGGVGASAAPRDLVIAGSGGGYALQNLSPFESGETTQWVLELLYDPGMVFDPLTGETMSWAFDDWELDHDAMTATATLREGLTWTDGEAVTAGDVAFTVGELTADRSFVFGELGRFETAVLDDVRAVDGRTVAYAFGEPAGHWQAPLATPILPEHVWADVDEPEKYRPMEADGAVVSSSPFQVTEFEARNHVTLEARPDAAEYPMVDGAPVAEGVRFQQFGSEQEATTAVRDGDAHVVLDDVNPETARSVAGQDNIDVVASPSGWYDTLGFNLRRVPFDDRAFRQLLARVADVGLAADHREVAPGDLPIPDAFPHLRPAPPGEVDGFPFPGTSGEPVDVEAARSFLLAHTDATHDYSFEPGSGGDAPDGAVLHVDGEPLGEAHTDNGGTGGQGPLVLTHHQPLTGFKAAFAEKLVADLRRVGVPVDRQAVHFSELIVSVLQNEEFDAYLLNWSGNPIGTGLREIFHSENADLDGTDDEFASNVSGYGGADDVLDRLRSTTDPSERVELVQVAARQVYEDCPVVVPAYRRHVQPVAAAWTDHVGSPEGIVNRYSMLGPGTVRTAADPDVAVSPSAPSVGETVTFDAAGTEAGEGEIRRYVWDVGADDTADGEGITFETSFAEPGEHVVRLTVVDEFGARATTERTVEVSYQPSPTATDGADRRSGGGSNLAIPLGVGGLLAAGGAAAWWRRRGDDPPGDAAPAAAGGPTGGGHSVRTGAGDHEQTDEGVDVGPTDDTAGEDEPATADDDPDDIAEDDEPATTDDNPDDAPADERPSARGSFEVAVERGEAAAEEAETLLERGNLDGAEAALRDALEDFEAARERAADAGIEDAAAVAGVESTEARLREVDRRRLAADVEDIAAWVDDAEDDLDAGALDDAADAFEAARAEAADLAATAREDGLDGVASSAEDLRERCASGLAAVEDARERTDRPGPPASIPEVPRADLSYDDLVRGELVGKGGNADVYRATATVDGRDQDLAVKEPRFSGTLHAETVERFAREAETWAKLDDHDHVVTVVDYSERPLPWIAMEYMDAGGLGERLGVIGPREATWYGVCMARALKHAHRRGVSHLDLKPANVLFRETPGDDWDVPKVADWGLAKMLLDHSKSIDGLTPQYAAPEQFDDDRSVVDHQTDVYQLGAVLYELYTGEPVFTGSAIEVVRKVADEPVTPPTEVDPSLPSAVDDVLLRALAKDRGDRYEDLIYLRDDLEALLADL